MKMSTSRLSSSIAASCFFFSSAVEGSSRSAGAPGGAPLPDPSVEAEARAIGGGGRRLQMISQCVSSNDVYLKRGPALCFYLNHAEKGNHGAYHA